MKRTECVFREILYQVMEMKRNRLTQSGLSKELGISLSVVNLAVRKLESIGAVMVEQRSLKVIDTKKALYYWASIRNLEKDVVFKARMNLPVREMERNAPNVVFTAYSAYKLLFHDVPADYSEVYVYADAHGVEQIKKRLSSEIMVGMEPANFFALKKDSLLERYDKIPMAQLFVDLWNLKEWYAREFVQEFEKRLGL